MALETQVVHSLTDMESAMTIFYSKRTGAIITFATGIQSMKFFAENEEDFILIYDFIVANKDQYVLDNIEKFVITKGAIKLKDEYKTNLEQYY